MIIFFALLMPVSALLTGPILWVLHRDETVDDGALVRNFVFIMVLFMALGFGLSRTRKLHMLMDPVYRIQTQIDENTLYAAIKENFPSQADAFRVQLAGAMMKGATIEQALLLTRSYTWRQAGEKLPWASQAAKIEWAEMTLDSLRELKARDPMECYRAVAHVALSPQTLTAGFSPQNSAAFQTSTATVLRSANTGMAQRGMHPGEVAAPFDQIQKAGREVYDRVAERFGKDVAEGLYRHRFPALPAEQATVMCSARLYQLDASLKFPEPIAASLASEALRVY